MLRIRPDMELAIGKIYDRLPELYCRALEGKAAVHAGDVSAVAGQLRRNIRIELTGAEDVLGAAQFDFYNCSVSIYARGFETLEHLQQDFADIIVHEISHAVDELANPLKVFREAPYVKVRKALERLIRKGGYKRRRLPHLSIERRAVELAKDAQKDERVSAILREHGVLHRHEAFGLLTMIFNDALIVDMNFMKSDAVGAKAMERGRVDYARSESEIRAVGCEIVGQVVRSLRGRVATATQIVSAVEGNAFYEALLPRLQDRVRASLLRDILKSVAVSL